METRLYYSETVLLLWSAYRTPAPHRHLAAHVVVSPTGSLVCRIGETGEGVRTFATPAALIAPDMWHTVEAQDGGPMAVFLFDGTTDAARAIVRKLAGKDAAPIEPGTAADLQRVCARESNDLERCAREATALLGLGRAGGAPAPRVEAALATIRNLPRIDSGTIASLCDRACLSQSRFSHLFRESTGIALNRYLVLQKMRRAVEGLSACGDLSRAAMDAGFASPSHFSATCQRMFGISMSEFLASMGSARDTSDDRARNPREPCTAFGGAPQV